MISHGTILKLVVEMENVEEIIIVHAIVDTVDQNVANEETSILHVVDDIPMMKMYVTDVESVLDRMIVNVPEDGMVNSVKVRHR